MQAKQPSFPFVQIHLPQSSLCKIRCVLQNKVMRERHRNNNHSSDPLGICQRLFNFFLNSLIAGGLKRVTLGEPYCDSLGTSKSGGYELMVHHKDHDECSNSDSGSDVQVFFKQSEEMSESSWTAPVVSKVSGKDKFGDQQQQPLAHQKKTEQQVHDQQGKSSQDVPAEPSFRSAPRSRGPEKRVTVGGSEGEDISRNKMKGKSIPSDNLPMLTTPEEEELKRTPRRLRPPLAVAPNINEKSDQFIKNKKAAMRRS